ncbi:ferredoxin Fer [Haloarcula litorea]|uniref:ferredoxin Fer n=1 Tax=Haloarcula litorea TaxID=3032579 RepID=UPI0023E88378|nr:ferredoxin Fer [Halomicroarcula sp. GDY20]
MASPYEILGVDPDADDAEIVDAYRRRVKDVHPDHGGSPDEFRAVQEAYELLQNGYEPGDEVVAPDAGDGETAPASEQDDAEPSEPPEPEGVVVEYLDYEVIADHGWDLGDDDLFEKAADGGLDPERYGQFRVADNETLLEAAEDAGYDWPFACRGGACTNCAVAVVEGEMPSPASHVLPQELHEKGIRLSCIAAPATDAKIVFNVKHLPAVSELLLPASRYDRASTD